ncbi:hypothetical protein [Legionella sp. W05-934-2]|uniref:hypothetical protein n=1 Tax=Legionella sp. W05-934-2 TaxID=1198649 RepID=UPI00346213E9
MAKTIKKVGKGLQRLRNTRDLDESDDTGGRSSRSGRGGRVDPPKLPSYISAEPQSASMLAEDSVRVEWDRRAQEQAGEGHYGKVNVKERREEDKMTPEGELLNDIPQHPLLNRQTYDGVPINDNPEPPLNSDARREYDNAKRLQHQKQLQLKNELTDTPQYQPSSAPTPRPGG